jgi:arginyl-tRNA synthetase
VLQFGYILKKGIVVAMSDMKAKSAALEYKGHPLRRKDNLIYFGSMADKYIIMLQILDTKKIKDMDVATKVAVQLQLTDPDLKSRDRVVKKSEKNSLYAAMDVASVWLERALTSR